MVKKKSLKWVLILSLVMAIIIPLTITGTIFTQFLSRAAKERIISANESLSKSFLDQIDSYLGNAINDLKTLRTMVEKQDFEMLNHTSLLDSIRENKEQFTKIQIINKSGLIRFISPNDREYIHLDMSTNRIFTEPMNSGKAYWSPAFIPPGSSIPVVSISIPFENGVMAGFLSLEHLALAAKRITRDKPIYVTITDQTSSYIVHFQDKLILQRGFDPYYSRFKNQERGKLVSQTMDIKGESIFVTSALIPETEWAIVFFQPVKLIFAPLASLYLYMGLGLICLILITVLLCIKHIRIILATLDSFTESARTISRGNYNRRIDPAKYQEFSQLTDQFDAMADAIQEREAKLVEKEEEYRSIFIAAKDAIIIADAQKGRILDVNDFACSLYGYEKSEFLTLSILDISNERGNTWHAVTSCTSWVPQRVHKKKDGSLFTVEVSISYHKGPGNTHISTVVARDITSRLEQEKEKQQMERLLGQAQKMEAIGRLAGGIAHDFNNILAAIVGFSELTLKHSPQDSKPAKYTSRVLKASKRAKELVAQILTFARSSDIEKKPVSVNEILNEVIKFIRASLPASIEICTQIKSSQRVMADPIQLHQVIMNLCTNAWHAMGQDGGTLTLRLEELKGPSASLPAHLPGKAYLRLEVEDTGLGIEPENLTKIFDPYFTTKKAGEGTGMGLSVVQGIIRDTGGFIDVASKKGKGTTFRIFLPVSSDFNGEITHGKSALKKGTETILVVDDEKDIAEAMALNLESMGYKVVAENIPKKALGLIEKGRHFDLVITDMSMPEINGEALARKILAIRPKMPMILCTGFHGSMTPEKARQMGIKGFLYKPMERSTLSRAIRKALD